jgi:hypothetical protein
MTRFPYFRISDILTRKARGLKRQWPLTETLFLA